MNLFQTESTDITRALATRIWTTSKLNDLLAGVGLVLGTLAFAVAGVRLIVPPVSVELHVASAATPDRDFAPGPSDGLGGLAADLWWLRTHESWMAQDLERTQAGLRLTVAANPRPLAFWLNGARIMAYDMPEWRIARIGRSIASAATLRRINREQAHEALAWLERAREFHPHAPEIFVEQALIQWYRLHDATAAAQSFQWAAEQPGAPGYAMRLHDLLLRRPGQRILDDGLSG